MARTYYERLSAKSASFLLEEGSSHFSHSAALLIFEPGNLASAEDGVDFDAIRAGVEARLTAVPRARQRLRWMPVDDAPVWVDDADFSLEYHLRHTSLPRPGSDDQLERMVARIHAQRLDRSRPLWECWVLEGLEGGRFAMLWKTHHCMVDPDTGADLIETILSPDEDAALPSLATYRPRPAPSAVELLRDQVRRRMREPLRQIRRVGRQLRRTEWRHTLEDRLRGAAKLAGYSMRPRNPNPLSGPSGPHRRYTSRVLPLADAQGVRKALSVSLHDVLLAVVSGALHDFFHQRLVNPATVDFRISAPVSLDTDGEGEEIGEWILELPIWERDPLERVRRIQEQTDLLREENPALAARTLLGVAQWSGSRRLALAARSVSRRLPVDLALVNLPGPQTPLYFRGARLLQGFGIAPLRRDHALGITVMSYDGQLCWGFNADFDRLPDLSKLADALENAFDELVAATAPKLKVVEDAC